MVAVLMKSQPALLSFVDWDIDIKKYTIKIEHQK